MDSHPRYQLLEKIGSGSYATVYRARDLELGREVAVKQIHQQFLDDPQQLERYWAEAQLLASFQHPNIVTIYDLVRDRGWLVLELMQGSLAKIAGRKQMDLGALRATLAHSLRALKFLHEHGIVHGDVKPGNMMIDRRKRVKVGDFGLARRVSDAEGSLIKGTTKYMAPEVVSDEFGSVGPASDLYSLGFAAVELMCGENFETLFPGLGAFGRDKQMAWMMWHAAPDRRLPQINRIVEGVPDDLAKCLQKLTAKSQADRYKSADEALSDLNVDLKIVKTGEEAGPPPEGMTPDKMRRLIAIGGFVISLLICGLWLALDSKPRTNLPNIPDTTGILRSVSPDKGTIEIASNEDIGKIEDIYVGRDARVQLNYDSYIRLRELHKGDRIEVRTVEDPKKGRRIELSVLRPESSHGIIRTVNAPDGTLAASVDEGRSEIPLQIGPNSRVELNGRTAKLEDLQGDDRIDVQHVKNNSERGARLVTELVAFRTKSLRGFVRQFDPTTGRIEVEQPGGRDDQIARLQFAEKSSLTLNGDSSLNGQPVKPSDLKPGDRIVLTHDVKIIEAAAWRRPRLTGVVMQVNDEPPTVTVQTKDGRQTVFGLAPGADVSLNRSSSEMPLLRKFDNVEISYEEKGEERLAKSVDATRSMNIDRLAVLIAVQNYQDRNFSRLTTSRSDVQLLRNALIQRYGFYPEKILVLNDPDRKRLESGLSEWAGQATNTTQLWVYFAGNAYTDDGGTVYLAPADAKWNDLPGTCVKLESALEKISGSVAREKILLLDGSHAGKGPDHAKQPSSAEMVESLVLAGDTKALKTVSVIASCSKGESGRIWPEKEHGVFAWFTADAFFSNADKNRDLLLSPQELYDYLKLKMITPSSPGQPAQTPALIQR